MDDFTKWLVDHNIELPKEETERIVKKGMTAGDLLSILQQLPPHLLNLRIGASDSQYGPQEFTGINVTDYEGFTIDGPEEYDTAESMNALRLLFY